MKKLIFDFDGTLVDSMPDWGKKMLYTLEKAGVSYPNDIVKTLTPLGDKGSAEYMIKALGVTDTVEQLIALMDEYAWEKYAHDILEKPTVRERLLAWKAAGYSLNVLTASPHKMLDVCLKRLGLYELFDNIWSTEDFSLLKSDVRIYERVAKLLDTTCENCLFFDDNLYALSTAKRAGMIPVGVYDDSAKDDMQTIASFVSQYVFSFAEIQL